MARLVLLLDKAALWLLMMIYLVRLLLLIQLIDLASYGLPLFKI